MHYESWVLALISATSLLFARRHSLTAAKLLCGLKIERLLRRCWVKITRLPDFTQGWDDPEIETWLFMGPKEGTSPALLSRAGTVVILVVHRPV